MASWSPRWPARIKLSSFSGTGTTVVVTAACVAIACSPIPSTAYCPLQLIVENSLCFQCTGTLPVGALGFFISKNVASVTVTAITQGLIEPSGMRSFEMSLFFMRQLYYAPNTKIASTWPELFRYHRGIYIHARPQHGFFLWNGIEDDFHGNALHHLHVVSRGVFRREQAQHRASGSGDGIDMAAKHAAVGIDTDLRLLPRLQVAQLRFLKVRGDPHILQRHHHQQALTKLYNLAGFHLFVRSHTIDGCNHFRVTKVEFGGFQRGLRLFHFGDLRTRVRRAHDHLMAAGLRGNDSSTSLFDAGLRH